MVTFHTKPGEKERKIGAWMITAVLTAAILTLAAPLVIGAGYTYPSADDFIVEGGSISLSREFDSFRGPLYAAWNYFMEWQGAYTSNILLFIPMPYTRFGLNGFRFCMVLISLFFVCSLYFMVHAVVEYAGTFNQGGGGRHSRQNRKLFLFAVLLFAALGLPETYIGTELFYWYTATAGYLSGISSLFVAIGGLLMANCGKRRKGYYICSILFAFLASGASPEVASFVCSWLLLVLLALFLAAGAEKEGEKRLGLWDIVPFVSAFAGALINVCAPGTIQRSRATMEENAVYGVLDAIRDTIGYQKDELREIWRDPLFIALTLIVFVVCLCFEVRVARAGRFRTPIGVLLITGGVAVSHFLCIFPVVLGYHGEGLVNCRTKYVAYLEIRFSILFAVIYLAQYILQVSRERQDRRLSICAAGIVCGFLVCLEGFVLLHDRPDELLSGYSFELIRDISNGTVQEIFGLRKEVLEALEAAEEGTDVYLQMPELPSSRVTYSQGITGDTNSQVNVSIARILRLNSVAVEYGAVE